MKVFCCILTDTIAALLSYHLTRQLLHISQTDTSVEVRYYQGVRIIMTCHKAGVTALDHFEIIVRIIAGNEVAYSLLEKLLSSAEHYFCKAIEMETRLSIAQLSVDGNELCALTENLDKNRSYAHEALISDLHIFNRYIVKEFANELPKGGIFNRDPELIHDRIAVADWAGDLMSAVYQNRKR